MNDIISLELGGSWFAKDGHGDTTDEESDDEESADEDSQSGKSTDDESRVGDISDSDSDNQAFTDWHTAEEERPEQRVRWRKKPRV